MICKRIGLLANTLVRAVTTLILLTEVARAAATAQLQIYFIDVEGGQSTLVVTPEHETLLIDAGWAGEGSRESRPGDAARARDPNRIVMAMRDAGVDHIDYLLVTHFHRDHIGGIPELAQLVPIRTFIDYGSAYPPAGRAALGADSLDAAAYDDYRPVRAHGRHLVPKPGELLPLRGIEARVVSVDRGTLRRPLPGAGGVNTSCRPSPLPASDEHGQNPRSTGIVLTFGKFRFLDLGDLSGGPLYDLACPRDRIGAVDIYLVAHHGGADAADPATLTAFRPRAAVVNNAPRKGGQRPTLQMLRAAQGVDSWQLHVADGAGEDNAPSGRIANLDETSAHWLKATAGPDGSFSIVNPRTGAATEYGVRQELH